LCPWQHREPTPAISSSDDDDDESDPPAQDSPEDDEEEDGAYSDDPGDTFHSTAYASLSSITEPRSFRVLESLQRWGEKTKS